MNEIHALMDLDHPNVATGTRQRRHTVGVLVLVTSVDAASIRFAAVFQ